MKVRLFEGADFASAVGAVRRSLGPEALIVETRHTGKGIEILAAIEPTTDELQPLDIPSLDDAYLDDRRCALAWHGLSRELIGRLTEPNLAEALAKRLPFGKLIVERDSPPLFFSGLPGAGKSLSIIKVATRCMLTGTTPLVISSDGQKAGATEQLAAMTRILGLTLLVADQPTTLTRALAMRVDGAPVLIDGPGISADDEENGSTLRALVEPIGAELVFVTPAGLDAGETTDLASHMADLGAKRMIATRLDVTRRIGGIVEAAWRSRLLLTEAGIGPNAVASLEMITPEMLAVRLEAKPPDRVRSPLKSNRAGFGVQYGRR